MKVQASGFTFLLAVSLMSCIQAVHADRTTSIPVERIVTTEAGVLPAGTQLVVRSNDTVSTSRASADTIYGASLAADILDQDGRVLIPKESPVDMGVFSFGYLGPGGGPMTELVLGVREVTVTGMVYPVETAQRQRDGGLGSTEHMGKWVGGTGEPHQVLTRGRRIYVPRGALLSFQTIDPIRLKGYQR
jgi:hypothetical protein